MTHTARNVRLSLATGVGLGTALLLVPLLMAWPALRNSLQALSTVDPIAARLIALGLLEWLPAIIIALLVVVFEQRSLRSLGLHPLTSLDARWALRVVGITGVTFWLSGLLLGRLGATSVDAGLTNIARLPIWLRLIVALSAGVCEELVYRGFLIERLTELTGNLRLASLISYVAFVLPHALSWGWGATLQIGLASIAFVWLYASRRSLRAVMIAHTLNDVLGFGVWPLLA